MSDLEETGAAYLRLLNAVNAADKTIMTALKEVTDPVVRSDIRNAVIALRAAAE